MFIRIIIACVGILILILLVKPAYTVSDKTPKRSDSIPFREAIPFKYNNHYYISFINYGHYTPFSIIHDPDCPCYAKRN
jgi:hypothetical protein